MDDNKKVLPLRNSGQEVLCDSNGLRVGKVVGADAKGRLLVDYPGNELGHIAARLTSSAKEKLLQGDPAGREVLLGFLDDDSHSPIILDTLCSAVDEVTTCFLEADATKRVVVDRKRLILHAEEEVVVRCGEASITLTKDGKVLIRGSYLVSRASGTNSIKGSSVRIN